MAQQDIPTPIIRINTPPHVADADAPVRSSTPRSNHVRLPSPTSTPSQDAVHEKRKSPSTPNKVIGDGKEDTRMQRIVKAALAHHWISWISPKLTWGNMKPVIRVAAAAWLGLLLVLVHPTLRAMGYAAFFVLVVAFMLPPHLPLVQSLESYATLYLFTGIAWAWVALGVFIAGQVREPTNPAKIAAAEAKWSYLAGNPAALRLRLVYEATYLEAKSAVVCSIFLCVGTGAFLWYKLRTQPSPATFPCVLACILIDIGLTTAALYPYPLYTSGLLFFEPMAIQGGLGILCSLLIFPESVGHSFQAKLTNILGPLNTALTSIETLFADTQHNPIPDSDHLEPGDDHDVIIADRLEDWAEKSAAIRLELLKSLAGVAPCRAQQRYLSVDISYSRLSGSDLRDLFDLLAVVQTRSGGMAFFFDVIVSNARHGHLDSSAFSVHHASHSRPISRQPSVREMNDLRAGLDEGDHERVKTHSHGYHDDSDHEETESGRDSPSLGKRFHLPGFLHRRSGSPHLNGHRGSGSHMSLLDGLRKAQQPVGVYESQRYMDVERIFSQDTAHVLEQLNLLADGSLPLIQACQKALSTSVKWLQTANRDRHVLPLPVSKRVVEDEKAVKDNVEDVTANLQSMLDDFHVARLAVVKPYCHVFDPAHPPSEDANYSKLHYRGLFQNFVAQYHMIEFAEALLKLLRLIETLDKTRTRRKFWYPTPSSLFSHLRSTHTEKHLTDGNGNDNDDGTFAPDEDDPDELGVARRRDPEYTPFDSSFLNLLSRLEAIPNAMRSRSFMYAIKAAVLGGLTTLPQYLSSSAAFYYYNRGIWCTIMAQLTLAVYSGEITTAWIGRIVASFWGCLLGMVAWYIGSGSGSGNAYGLAVVGAVTFPMAAFFRVHFPGPVLTAVMTPVTFGLVIGYSYLNANVTALTNVQWGWDVAWRRFVCVVIGITAAWVFSYVPPVYSGKRAIRYSYARTIAASGSILCDILSYANDPHNHLQENVETRTKLLEWRSKLNKLGIRHAGASYEYSIRGRWPEERYKALLETLQDLLSLLAQLNHVLAQLDRPWRKALLDRTRLSDPVFLGDVLAILTMCSTGLRAGSPLPQITPSPLVARFRMGKTKGLEIPHDPSDHGEIPSLVTIDVLESDNYMRYALGATTTYSIMARLDRIVVICKTLLGENYHISGLHFESQQV